MGVSKAQRKVISPATRKKLVRLIEQNFTPLELQRIGKCELCRLAGQVRAAKLELGERAMAIHSFDAAQMEEYETCASELEELLEMIHRLESRHHEPIRNLQDELDSWKVEGELYELLRAERVSLIQKAMRLISASDACRQEDMPPR